MLKIATELWRDRGGAGHADGDGTPLPIILEDAHYGTHARTHAAFHRPAWPQAETPRRTDNARSDCKERPTTATRGVFMILYVSHVDRK